jgi:hypothetical protein
MLKVVVTVVQQIMADYGAVLEAVKIMAITNIVHAAIVKGKVVPVLN